MNWWRRFRSRDALEDQLDAELRDHLERLVADHVAAGVPDEEARRRARLELGGLEQTKEICRDARGLNWIDETTQHLHYALRTFRRTPGFSAMIVGTLGLAIGANTAIFSVAKAVILTPLPFRDPDRVVLLFDGNQGDHYLPGRENILMTVRPGRFQDWREHCHSFEGMAIVRPKTVIVSVGDRAVSTDAFLAGDDYFQLLGVPAEIGRALTALDCGPDGGRVAVLSHRLWREGYNADPSAVGRDSLWRPRLAALLVGVFAVLAVLIAMCGLYAVISYAVARRTRELGMRLALGATGRRIATLIVGHGLRVTAIGIILGSMVTVVVTRLSAQAVPPGEFSEWEVTHLSIQQAPSLADFPWLLPAVAGLLVVLTIVACWVPVRRALAVDPITALRTE